MQDVCQTVRIHDSHVCLVMPGLGINTFVQEFTAYAENYLSEIIPIEIGKTRLGGRKNVEHPQRYIPDVRVGV